MLQKQQDLTLANRTGKLEIKSNSDKQGLYDIIKLKNKSSFPSKIAFDLEGGAFACIDRSGNGTMYYISKNRYIHFITPASGQYLQFIEKNNGFLAVALKNNNIAVYNNLNGKLVKTLKWHTYSILDLQINHMKDILMSVSHDCCALWNLNTYQRGKTLFAKSGKFVSAVFAPSGNQIITLFQDGSVYFWNLDTLEPEHKTSLPGCKRANGLKLQCSLESDTIAVAGQGNSIYICNISRDNYIFREFDLPQGCPGVASFKFFIKGYLCFLGTDQQFYVVQTSLGNSIVLKHCLPGGRSIIDFDINIKAETLLAAASTGEIFLYDLKKLIDSQKLKDDTLITKGCDSNLVRQTLTLKSQKPLKSQGSGSKKDEEYDDKENRIIDASEHQTIYEEVYVVQQGGERQKKVLFQNSINEPKNYRDGHKLENLYKSSQVKIGDTYMSADKLKGFLKKFKQYPDKHRGLIYKYLLQLPENFEAYDNLINKGLHSAFTDLNKKYPMDSQKLYTKMQRIMSALSHYCPVFSEMEHVPSIVFPFVKLFAVDEVLTFEIVLSFLIQWGQHLFEFFPNPPINLLQAIDDILKQNDSQLHEHLRDCDFGLNNYLWPPLQVLFTDMLSRSDWLCFMDYLVTNPDKPELLLYFVAAFFIHYRDPLLKIKTPQQLDIFMHRQASIKIQAVLDRAMRLCKLGGTKNLLIKFENNLPLTKNQYPIFNFYPQFAVDQHARMRENIQDEERKLIQRQTQIAELAQLTENLQVMEERLRDKEEHLLRAEKDRRDMALYEDEIRQTRKEKADQQLRDQRIKHLTNLERQLREGVDRQQALREKEEEIMVQDIIARENQDNKNMQNKMEEEALANLEMKSAARMNELIALRAREERLRKERIEYEQKKKISRIRRQISRRKIQSRRLRIKIKKKFIINSKRIRSARRNLRKLRKERIEYEQKKKQAELEDRLVEERYRAEDQELRLRRNLLQTQKELEVQEEIQENQRRERQKRLAETEFLKDMKMQEVARERKMRQILEEDELKNQELQRLKEEQKEILQNEEKKHIDMIISREKDNQLIRARERLRILEIEKAKQQEEINEHMQKLKDIKNDQYRQELEEKIVNIRREGEKNIIEEEKRCQQMILDIEEERRVQQQLVDDIENRELQYKHEQAQHEQFLEREQQRLEDERQHFNDFREQVREEMGRSDEQMNSPTLGQEDLADSNNNREMNFDREEEVLRKTAQLKLQLERERLKKLEETQKSKGESFKPISSAFQSENRGLPSAKYSAYGPNTQSLYSYSQSDESKSKKSPFNSTKQTGILKYDNYQPQYPSQQIDPQVESLTSSENSRPQREEFGRYRPGEHYDEEDDDDSDEDEISDNQRMGTEQLAYSSGPSGPSSAQKEYY